MKTKFILLLIALILSHTQMPAQNESTICRDLFVASYDITKSATDVISLAVDAVWAASEINNIKTITGTLTQNPMNLNSWSYSPSPNDRLNLNFANGAVVSFTFYQIDGYTEGDAENFKYSHQMDFTTNIQNYMNMRIFSRTYPENDSIYWNRTITGTNTFDNQLMTLNITHTGKIYYEISGGWALYEYKEKAFGNAASGSLNLSINEGYWRKIIHNSNESKFALNTEILNNSSATVGNNVYKYQNAYVFWAAWTQLYDSVYTGAYNLVLDHTYWNAQGTMLKNNQTYGTVMFDGPVVENSWGPNLVLHLSNGSNIFLHTLINDPMSDAADEISLSSDYKLMQNYPNPFNSSTVIRWEMRKKDRVKITIYDILGKQLETILDEERPAGINEIRYECQLPSGIYFYKISAGDFNATKKMILLK